MSKSPIFQEIGVDHFENYGLINKTNKLYLEHKWFYMHQYMLRRKIRKLYSSARKMSNLVLCPKYHVVNTFYKQLLLIVPNILTL